MQMAGAARPEGLSWQISSYCNGGTCIQVARAGDIIYLGDSKDPEGPALTSTRQAWQHLIDNIKDNRFDHI
jgi:hypothetical protein